MKQLLEVTDMCRSRLPAVFLDVLNLMLGNIPYSLGAGGGEGGFTPGNSWWWCAMQFPKSWPYFRPKNVIFHTCFQTRSLISIPVFIPGLWAEIMSSLLTLELKQKKILQIHFEFKYFPFFLWNNKLIRSYTPIVPSKTIPDSRPKWAKFIYTHSQTKKAQKPYPLGWHIPIWLM